MKHQRNGLIMFMSKDNMSVEAAKKTYQLKIE